MKKKILSVALSALLLINCMVFTVTAQTTVNIDFDAVVTAADRMADYLSLQDAATRQKLFRLVQSYIDTDPGMDSLAEMVDNPAGMGELSDLFDVIGISTQEQKDALQFAIRFAKCIPVEVRRDSFAMLANKTEFPGEMNAEEEAAFKDLCSAFVDSSFIEMVAQTHNWTPKVLYNFVTEITKVVTLTDSRENPSDFAVRAIDPAFAARLEEEFGQDAPVINGVKFTTADALVKSLVETVNNSEIYTDELIEQTKNLVEDTNKDNYIPAKAEINHLLINTPENLVQATKNPVVFTVEYLPADGDPTLIEWYVNDEKQPVTGAEFTLNPTGVGEYVVYAKTHEANGKIVSSEAKTAKVVAPVIPTPTPTPSTGGNHGGSGITIKDTPTPTPTRTPGESLEEIPAPPVAVSSFTDAKDHWAKDYLEVLANKGIFAGDGNGTIRPDFDITREEMAMLLVRILGVDDKMSATTKQYTDYTEIAGYAREAVGVLSEMGVYMGYDDGSFKPKQVISREEIMALFDRILDDIEPDAVNFTDNADISPWAVGAVEQMVTYGIVGGYPDGSLRPGANVTRAEAGVMIYKLMFRRGTL